MLPSSSSLLLTALEPAMPRKVTRQNLSGSWQDHRKIHRISCVLHLEPGRSKVCFISGSDLGFLTLDNLCLCLTPMCFPCLLVPRRCWQRCWAEMAETSRIFYPTCFCSNLVLHWGVLFISLILKESVLLLKTSAVQTSVVRGDSSSSLPLAPAPFVGERSIWD